MLVAMALNFLSTLCQQTVGCLLPINVDRFPTLFSSTNIDRQPTGLGLLIASKPSSIDD